MRAGLLRGRDHTEIGAVGLIADGPCAIALCRGGASKSYAHTDPNEDAVAFAYGPAGAWIAVADGHDGATGAETALEHLLSRFAEDWTDDPRPEADESAWRARLQGALSSANDRILERAAAEGLPPAPTTLSMALVRWPEKLLLHGSAGDSHVFPVGADGTGDVGWASLSAGRTYFLGTPHRSAAIAPDRLHLGCQPLGELRAVVAATDGLSESGIGLADPATAVAGAVDAAGRAAPELRPLTACKAVARAAIEAQRANASGDNIASAVVWIPAEEG